VLISGLSAVVGWAQGGGARKKKTELQREQRRATPRQFFD
jgi:hypothetical protein